jgi:hypothetical protein
MKQSENQSNDEKHYEQKEKKSCYGGGCHRNARETEYGGDDRNNEKNQGPV